MAMTEGYVSRKGYGIKKKGAGELIAKLREELTVMPKVNPTAPGAAAAQAFPVYRENSTRLYVPLAFGYERFGEPITNELVNSDSIVASSRLEFKGSLRPDQEEPVAAFLASPRGGIISLKCAAGKTVMALYIACQIKQKTLVICHKNFLLDQWKERINEFIPTASVGLIKAKTIDTEGHDIVMASLQSIAMKDYDPNIFNQFGYVIVDEVHHVSAEVFSRALPKVVAPIMLGLSATLDRKDGLRKVFEWYIGKPVYESKKRTDTDMDIRMIKYYVPDPVYSKERKLWNGKACVPQMVNAICAYSPRDEIILNILQDVLNKEPNRKTIILSDRRAHLTALAKAIEARGMGTHGFYVGGMKQQALKESEGKNIILGTYTLVSEGFDVPRLNTLVFASPISSIEQAVGRIQRQKPCDREYTPLIIDIWDEFSVFRNQGFRRHKFYKKNNYSITMSQINNAGEAILSRGDNSSCDGDGVQARYEFINDD